MPKGVPNKRYTPEFKKLVIETMQEEKLSYSETGLSSRHCSPFAASDVPIECDTVLRCFL